MSDVQATSVIHRSRHSREPIEFELVTDPPITAWEASFDDGDTWHPGQAVTGKAGHYQWLVAGAAADKGAAVVQLGLGSHEVIVRGAAGSTLVVRDLAIIEID